MNRVCKKCSKEKPLSSFPKSWLRNPDGSRRWDGHRQWTCSNCKVRKRNLTIGKERASKARKGRNLRRSCWTEEQLEAVWEQQRGLCAICSVPMSRDPYRLDSVTCDHDHRTGKPRGLLCNRCNRLEGQLTKAGGESWFNSLKNYLSLFT